MSGQVNASDIDGDTLHYAMTTTPAHGVITLDDQGAWQYTPDAGYWGQDAVEILVADGLGGTAKTTLHFLVNTYIGGDVTLPEQTVDAVYLDGVGKDDLEMQKDGSTLIVVVREKGTIRITGYFESPEFGLKRLETLDGSVHLGKDRIVDMSDSSSNPKKGMKDGHDQSLLVTGTATADVLKGAMNKDVLFASDGRDVAVGLKGNDVLAGGPGDDVLNGNEGDDTLYGDQGGDHLSGGNGNDFLTGGAGQDQLSGDDGNDILSGGLGNDVLDGGLGDDTYRFRLGDGQDTINNNDNAGIDTLAFGSGITPADIVADQLWFKRAGKNLEISLIGTSDTLSIQNWYSGSQYHVEQFKTSDGKVLVESQVDALVSAMAAFAPPSSGQTTLPQDYQTALAPVIAANWH